MLPGRDPHEGGGGFPDIEVIHTVPILDKLEVYRGFAVPEVWLFQDGSFAIHRLTDGRYARVERSGFLPDLDVAMNASGSQDAGTIARSVR